MASFLCASADEITEDETTLFAPLLTSCSAEHPLGVVCLRCLHSGSHTGLPV